MSVSSVKKTTFLGSLYLTQTIPKGYLKFLPVLMAERGDSLLLISLVALFSVGDWLKPLFGALLDTKHMSSMKTRKLVAVAIQSLIIVTFALSLLMEKPQLIHLAALFSFCSLLTSMHDTAVDGIAVQLLGKDEQAIGGFGQYAGYKLGSLLTGGILPAIVGTNHQILCIGIIIPMIVVVLFTLSFDMSKLGSTVVDKEASDATKPTNYLGMLRKYFCTMPGLRTVLMLFAYKFADHGLDFIWFPMLVQANISRKTIVQTQFVLGTLAAIVGAMYGTFVCKMVGSATKALAFCAVLRILPNLMQLWFVYNKSSQNMMSFISVHAVLENIAGSAVTGAMFALLLEKSDRDQPATSYAIMNTIALVGMTAGEFVLSQCSHFYGFKAACALGVLINILFPVLALLTPATADNQSEVISKLN